MGAGKEPEKSEISEEKRGRVAIKKKVFRQLLMPYVQCIRCVGETNVFYPFVNVLPYAILYKYITIPHRLSAFGLKLHVNNASNTVSTLDMANRSINMLQRDKCRYPHAYRGSHR
jgi:hypothetical protein